MSEEKVIVKNIDAIQNFGAMNILCTDKTGTLTQDRIVLEMHLDIDGEENEEVLEFAYLNSFYQTGLKSLLDVAVLEQIELHEALKVDNKFYKVDEIQLFPPDHQALFQTGWFVESLMTQTLIVHIIRTAKIPFFQSRGSLPMILVTLTIMAVAIYMPFSPMASTLGFVPLPAHYFIWLALILSSYCLLTHLVKTWFVRKYGYN